LGLWGIETPKNRLRPGPGVQTKVLLDTDIGSDIDDAVCLAYLLAQPDCELLGITTVTGESVKRAMIASALCRVAGEEIPIYPGEENPIRLEQAQKTAPQAEALPGWRHDEDFPEGQAVEFLAETIESDPGEVTLLTIGPLTNIGILFRDHPEVARLLRGLVMMCGSYVAGSPQVEWNSSGDPDATRIVFSSQVPMLRAIGLNVTRCVRMGSEEVEERFNGRLLRPVLDFARIWFRDAREIVFHDPLAAATIFDTDVCRFGKGTVEIVMEGSRARTLWQPGGMGSHEVATEVDAPRFFKHLFAQFPRSQANEQ
jgi:purine nucleosidase